MDQDGIFSQNVSDVLNTVSHCPHGDGSGRIGSIAIAAPLTKVAHRSCDVYRAIVHESLLLTRDLRKST